MSKPAIIEEQTGFVKTIYLDDPLHNPIGQATIDQLENMLGRVKEDKSVRVLIVTGAGDTHFSVGANLKEIGNGVTDLKTFLNQRIRVFSMIENLGKPVIAAIKGYCLGGGLELALACHFRIASECAEMSVPEIDLGIAPGWGGGQRLLRTIGRSNALDLLLRGRRISGQEAFRMGLVSAVCVSEELMGKALELAQELSEKSPIAVSAIMDCIIKGEDMPLNRAIGMEVDAICGISGNKDNIEGITAFFEKRKPVFKGE